MRKRTLCGAALLVATGCLLAGPASAGAVTWTGGTLEFGKVPVGKWSAVQTVTVSRNRYCQPIPPDLMDCSYDQFDLAASGPFAIISENCSGPLGQSPCAVNLVYRSTAKGREAGFLRLSATQNPTGQPKIRGIPLAGVGCKPAKQVATAKKKKKNPCGKRKKPATVSFLDLPALFAKTKVGQESAPIRIEVQMSTHCQGGPPCAPVQETPDVAVSGPFAIANQDCMTTPTPSSCFVEVVYRPTRSGEERGFLRITGPTITGVPLVGTGVVKKPAKKKR